MNDAGADELTALYGPDSHLPFIIGKNCTVITQPIRTAITVTEHRETVGLLRRGGMEPTAINRVARQPRL